MSAHAPPMPRATVRALGHWLRQRSRIARVPLAVAVAAGAFGGLVLIAQCVVLARVIDAVVIGKRGLDAVSPLLWTLVALFALRAVVSAAAEAVAFEAGVRVVLDVRAQMQAHVVTLGPAWTRLQRTGTLTATLVDAADSIGRYYSSYLPQTVLAAFLPLAILVFVVPTDWVSGLIMALSAPLIPLFMIIIGRGTETLNQTQWRVLARLSGHVFDAIEGLTTLRLFGASRAEIGAVAAMSDAYRRATMAVLRVAFLSSLVLEFLATLGIAMVAVYVGFRLYYGEMRLLPGLTVLLLAPEFYRVLRGMGTQYHTRMEAVGAAEAISTLLQTVPPPTPSGGTRRLTGPVRTIRLEGVGFSHGNAVILDRVDLTLPRGHCVALCGRSGAGKSTVAELLLGFAAPTRGRVLVDDVDLALVDLSDWRHRVAYLPQRPRLFHGTLGDNIRLGRPDADPAAVRRALELAGAEPVVDRLSRGLDKIVGDRGEGLSGGEIRRVALARALVKDADLLVLDEPAAGLDAALAAHVARSVRSVANHRAVLVIAHYELSIRSVDAVMLLAGGSLTAVTGAVA